MQLKKTHLLTSFQIWVLVFLLKCLAAVIYIYYYQHKSGDLLFYQQIWEELRENGNWFYSSHPLLSQEPRVAFFIALSHPIYVLAQGNLWVMGMLMSCISFLGSFWAFQILKNIFPNAVWAVFIAFFIWPPVVLWTSGIGKEVFVAFFLYPMVALILKNNLKIQEWIFMAIGFAVLVFLKYYYAAFFATLASALLIWRFSKIKLIYLFGIILITAFGFSWIHPNLNWNTILDAIVVNNQKMVAETVYPSHLIQFWDLKPDLVSFAVNAPFVWFQGTFGPFWGLSWEMKTLAVVSWIQIPLAVLALTNYRYFDKNWVFFFVFYCCGLVLLLAFSAPNYGTLWRYKIATEPFWMSGLIYYSTLFKRPKS